MAWRYTVYYFQNRKHKQKNREDPPHTVGLFTSAPIVMLVSGMCVLQTVPWAASRWCRCCRRRRRPPWRPSLVCCCRGAPPWRPAAGPRPGCTGQYWAGGTDRRVENVKGWVWSRVHVTRGPRRRFDAVVNLYRSASGFSERTNRCCGTIISPLATYEHIVLSHVLPYFIFFVIELDRQEAMGDRGDDMQQRTTGRNPSRVAAISTEP